MSDILLEVVLNDVVTHLEAGKVAGESGIPNVTTVTKGDYPTPTATKVQITADWTGSAYSGGVGMSVLKEDVGVAVRGYLADIPDDDLVNAAARELASAILNWMRKMKRYLVYPQGSRYILPSEKPDFRFTMGAEVRFLIKKFG